MNLRALCVTGCLIVLGLAGCANAGEEAKDPPPPDVSGPAASAAATPEQVNAPTDLTCPTEMRSSADAPFFDESAGGADSPKEAVEQWLASPLAQDAGFGPDYLWDASRKYAWVLRDDGTAEAGVTVKLTEGGYFYYGHEACA